MPLHSDPAISFNPSARKTYRLDSNSEFHYVSTRKQAAAKEVPISYLVARLQRRDYFLARL